MANGLLPRYVAAAQAAQRSGRHAGDTTLHASSAHRLRQPHPSRALLAVVPLAVLNAHRFVWILCNSAGAYAAVPWPTHKRLAQGSLLLNVSSFKRGWTSSGNQSSKLGLMSYMSDLQYFRTQCHDIMDRQLAHMLPHRAHAHAHFNRPNEFQAYFGAAST